MWRETISKDVFPSKYDVADERLASGKWLVPVPLGDPDGVWADISENAFCGDLDAAKISSPRLDRILGHHLVCVYSTSSDEECVRTVLQKLRNLGVKGNLRYKTDKATNEGREDFLWHSSEIDDRFDHEVHVEVAPSPK